MPRHVETAALRHGLERIFVPPPDVEDVLLDAAEARRLLRCEDGALAALIAAGLPCFGAAGDRLRRCDVLNLGLYSGSGRTIPEVAEAHRVRFASEPPDSWIARRTWAISIDLRCPREGCGEGAWHLPRPAPERFGGAVASWPASPARARSPLRIDATVEVGGTIGAVASAAVRAAYRELVDALVDGRLRYHYLPPAIRRDPERAAAHGVLDCLAASLLLQRRCRERGARVRTRRGLLLGSVAVEHVWVEAPAATGEWMPVDPVLAALVAHADAPDFADFACGSATNRLLPWDRDAGEGIFWHVCSDGATRGSDELPTAISARPLAI
jgi:hypothetical protein